MEHGQERLIKVTGASIPIQMHVHTNMHPHTYTQTHITIHTGEKK